MSKAYTPPATASSKTAVAEQAAVEQRMDKSIKVPTEIVPTTPATIFQNGINNFVKFLKGEFKSGSPEERAKFQCEFINNTIQMLSMSSAETNKVLDHFIITILENPVQFGQSEIFTPLYLVEKEKMKPADEIVRYKQFMSFMIGLAKNAKNRQRYVANIDLRKLLAMFPPVPAGNLQEYLHR